MQTYRSEDRSVYVGRSVPDRQQRLAVSVPPHQLRSPRNSETTVTALIRHASSLFSRGEISTILMHASGYRPERNAAHQSTLSVLPLILGEFRKADADYLEACRVKRNFVEYTVVVVARLSLPSNCTIETVWIPMMRLNRWWLSWRIS